MQRYIVNYLVGFLVLGAICPDTFARGISLFDALSDDPEADNLESRPDKTLDSADSFLKDNGLGKDLPKKSTKKRVLRKFVKVDLEKSRHSVTIEEGQSYELTCTVDSNPPASVFWIRGENPDEKIQEVLKASTLMYLSELDLTSVGRIKSKYVIDCASEKDQGPVHCVAVAGEKVSYQTSRIIVDESKKSSRTCNPIRRPVITQHMWGILSEMGSTVVLPCKAEGTPSPTTRWVDMSGREIVNHHYNDRYKILGTGDLMIENLEWNDMGSLTCKAESSAGLVGAETFLYPMEH